MVYGQGREARVCRKGEDGQGEPGSKSVKVCKDRIPGRTMGVRVRDFSERVEIGKG